MDIFKKPDIKDIARIACSQDHTSKDKKVSRKDKKPRKNNRILKK